MLTIRRIIYIISVLGAILLSSCISNKRFVTTHKTDFLIQSLDTSIVFRDGTCGMMVTDLTQNETLFAYNQDKRFVPASNIKLLTMAYALATLGDSIPSFRYITTDSTLTLYPCADPTLLHPYFSNTSTIHKLKQLAYGRKVLISDAHADINHFGYGWSWDDYGDNYQAETTAMPMFGNVLTVAEDSFFRQSPQTDLFNKRFHHDPKTRKITREVYQNVFYFPSVLRAGFRQEIPYFDAKSINIQLLSDTLSVDVSKISKPLPKTAGIIKSLSIDTIIRRMMQVSDNMLAEHLLLATGMNTMDTINVKASITQATSLLLQNFAFNDYRWVDGSGLSRHNAIKPQVLISILDQLYKQYPEDRLFYLLAIGGKPGSFRDVYNDEGQAYFYGKSGSMYGVYNQCGYLKTKKGKTLAISFMSNNMSSSSKEISSEVEKIVKWFRYNY